MNNEFFETTILTNDFEFWEGETKIVKYNIKNISHYPLRDIDFVAKTVKPDGTETSENFAKVVGEVKKFMVPGESMTLDVVISIPENYNDTYINKSGVEVEAPVRISTKSIGTRVIME